MWIMQLSRKNSGKMEVAWQRMIARNPYKYGTIDRVPKFVLERDYIKNTPYVERPDNEGIPFWARPPFHLECEASEEDHLEKSLPTCIVRNSSKRSLGKRHSTTEIQSSTHQQGNVVLLQGSS